MQDTSTTKTSPLLPDSKIKLSYYGSTFLLTLLMAFSVFVYFFKHAFIKEAFIAMGYPTYIIYPLAIVKILGLIAIWSRKNKLLANLAYAGFFYDCILAFFAHTMGSSVSTQWWPSVAALITVMLSYYSSKRLFD
jgi:hypothetical protein